MPIDLEKLKYSLSFDYNPQNIRNESKPQHTVIENNTVLKLHLISNDNVFIYFSFYLLRISKI